MGIQLTAEQWASVQTNEAPVLVTGPNDGASFVLVRTEIYERLKSIFEDDPIGEQERSFQLQQLVKRAGWDDPEMDVYDDLVPPSETRGLFAEISSTSIIRSAIEPVAKFCQ